MNATPAAPLTGFWNLKQRGVIPAELRGKRPAGRALPSIALPAGKPSCWKVCHRLDELDRCGLRVRLVERLGIHAELVEHEVTVVGPPRPLRRQTRVGEQLRAASP